MDRIILASASIRRQMLLKQIGIEFEVMPSNIDEKTVTECSPYEIVKTLAIKKARKVAENITEPAIIISADTVITHQGKILGKPNDADDAYKMLKLLSGTKHSVYTGMTVLFKRQEVLEQVDIIDSTDVFFRKLADEEIWAYIKTNEPYDKAGAYAIQEKGSLLIEKIDGDYYTVVGIPLVRLYLTLKKHGVDLIKMW